jgi:hypothetical protein
MTDANERMLPTSVFRHPSSAYCRSMPAFSITAALFDSSAAQVEVQLAAPAPEAPFGARIRNFDQIHAKSRNKLRRNLAAMTFFVAF